MGFDRSRGSLESPVRREDVANRSDHFAFFDLGR
jgi:hypothetical protein